MTQFSSTNIQKFLLLLVSFFIVVSIGYELYFLSNKDFPEGENNIVFMLDVSQSMNVIDMGNYSRLDAAKRKIIDIMRETSGNNYALNIFAGESVRILPFTQDIGLISTFLLGLDSSNIVKQGTDLESALLLSLESFNENQSGKVILLTDGSDESLSLSGDIKNTYDKKGVELLVIGVGTKKGGLIPSNNPLSPYKMYNGSPVNSSLNETSLIELSQDVSGRYVQLNEYNNYEMLGRNQKGANFPFIYLFFIVSWLAYLVFLYLKIYTQIKSLGKINL